MKRKITRTVLFCGEGGWLQVTRAVYRCLRLCATYIERRTVGRVLPEPFGAIALQGHPAADAWRPSRPRALESQALTLLICLDRYSLPEKSV